MNLVELIYPSGVSQFMEIENLPNFILIPIMLKPRLDNYIEYEATDLFNPAFAAQSQMKLTFALHSLKDGIYQYKCTDKETNNGQH
jgi:hypothetical protein